MTYDALTMHAVRDELECRVLGGHVDRAVLIDTRRVALEVFAHGMRLSIIFALDSGESRIFLSEDRARRATERVTPFSLLLRKYVAGAEIAAIEQPRLERLMAFQLVSRVEKGPPRRISLVAEAMGRRSNLTLVDEDGTVMDALVRAPPSMNPRRPILPHLRYVAPPREAKLDPIDDRLVRSLEDEARRHPEMAASDLLVRGVAGCSPLAAREALARVAAATDATASAVSWTDVVDALRVLVASVETRLWEPSVAQRDGLPIDYAPYRLTQFPAAEVVAFGSISEAIRAVEARPISAQPFDLLKQPLLRALEERAEQARRKRSSLERTLAEATQADDLREAGEAILASAHALEPGASALDWDGRRIDLYPTLSPAENAQSYFRRYANARDARKVVPPLLAGVEAELEYLDELALHVRLAASQSDIAALRAELQMAGILRDDHGRPRGPKRDKLKARSGLYRTVSVDTAQVLVGASALGNETVTFALARPDDLWFHARGVPGAHVVLRTHGSAPGADQVSAAAGLAAAHSAARDATRVEVDYTRRKYVRKARGEPPGRVTYANESTISVAPADGVARSRN